MFRCSFCNKSVPPKTPCIKVVKTCIYHHPFRPKVQRRWTYDKNGKLKQEWRDDKGGVGTQIVSEHSICPECFVIKGCAVAKGVV